MNILTIKNNCLFAKNRYIYEIKSLGRANVPNVLNVFHVLKTFAKTAKPSFGARPAANFPT